MVRLPILPGGNVAPDVQARIDAAVADQRTLGDVVRWDVSRPRPRGITDVVVQDEYTHDVVVEWDDGVFLVYDTT